MPIIPAFSKNPDPDLEYEFPSLWERVRALVIDYFIVALVVIIVYYLVWMFLDGFVIPQVLLYLTFVAYRIVFEYFSGTTIGKKRGGMLVVDSNFNHPGMMKIIKRNLFYIIFISIQFIVYWLLVQYKNSGIPIIATTIIIAGVLSGNWMLHLIAVTDLVMLEKDPMQMNRALHDRFAGTVVIKKKSIPPAVQ